MSHLNRFRAGTTLTAYIFREEHPCSPAGVYEKKIDKVENKGNYTGGDVY